MGGFDESASYEVLRVPRERYEAMAAIAIGRRADPAGLPEPLAGKETSSDRKPLSEVAIQGVFPGPPGGTGGG